MVLCIMKTTIEISEALLREAKKYAAQKGVSLKSVMETALRNLFEKRAYYRKFVLGKASFKGEGMQEGIQEGEWFPIRDKIYRGRGA